MTIAAVMGACRHITWTRNDVEEDNRPSPPAPAGSFRVRTDTEEEESCRVAESRVDHPSLETS